mgnify:CR=1 FL=1
MSCYNNHRISYHHFIITSWNNRFAKNCSKAKVVTKINKIAFDEVINRMDLDTIVYPKNITAEYIIWFVRAMKSF